MSSSQLSIGASELGRIGERFKLTRRMKSVLKAVGGFGIIVLVPLALVLIAVLLIRGGVWLTALSSPGAVAVCPESRRSPARPVPNVALDSAVIALYQEW